MKEITGNIASPKGFTADGIHVGIKKKIRSRMDCVRMPIKRCLCSNY